MYIDVDVFFIVCSFTVLYWLFWQEFHMDNGFELYIFTFIYGRLVNAVCC